MALLGVWQLVRSKKSSSPNVGAEKERYLKEEQERIERKLSWRKISKTMSIPEKERAFAHSPVTAAYGTYSHDM